MARAKKAPAKRKATKATKASKTSKRTTTTKKVTKTTAKSKTVARRRTTSKAKAEIMLKAISKKQTKAQIIADMAEELSVEKKVVKQFFEALKNQVTRHMKTRGSGEMTIPELGIKVKRVKKPATRARKGRNPFTGEEIMIAAKPARTVVKASALKALKELAAA